ncbi:ATP-binding cassette domain-containing protein [Hydrogenophaga sp.]|uniref:ATP-binding cassette domain-containing protein n=1 Tax=Hydrogenophaga sp. TaxID=1904254 RepID=UPI0035668697
MSAGPQHEPLFELQAVDVRLGARAQVHALSGVSLRIAAGERVALVGANGSGKSSLLRCLHGLLPVASGRLQLAPDLRMAMLFQRPHMLRLSARNNVALGLWLDGVPWSAAKLQALEALERVGLAGLAQRNARALSGGQQQRLALARAWARRPGVWLLDEPTASLDPHAKREVEALITDFAEHSTGNQPSTLIFSSHNLGQVKRLASRVLYLEQGRLLADLPTADFFNHERLQAMCPQAHAFVKGETP